MNSDRASSPAPAAAEPTQQPKLLERMRIHLRTRHYSIRTEQAYIDWARRFILFHGKRHPQDMGASEVEASPLALTMALAVADLADLNIFGVSFRLLRFVYDAAILAPYDKPVNSK